MKRRNFLKLFGLPIALVVPTVVVAKPVDDVIVGYQGKSKMESGYFYAPYIPVIRTSV